MDGLYECSRSIKQNPIAFMLYVSSFGPIPGVVVKCSWPDPDPDPDVLEYLISFLISACVIFPRFFYQID